MAFDYTSVVNDILGQSLFDSVPTNLLQSGLFGITQHKDPSYTDLFIAKKAAKEKNQPRINSTQVPNTKPKINNNNNQVPEKTSKHNAQSSKENINRVNNGDRDLKSLESQMEAFNIHTSHSHLSQNQSQKEDSDNVELTESEMNMIENLQRELVYQYLQQHQHQFQNSHTVLSELRKSIKEDDKSNTLMENAISSKNEEQDLTYNWIPPGSLSEYNNLLYSKFLTELQWFSFDIES